MTQVYDDIIVDDEFVAMIPPLSDSEKQQLEENIVEHGGARDPIVVWSKAGTLTVLDGHNRYEICSRLELPFDYHELRLKDRDEAADWIDRNQLGRRNLDPKQMSLLRGRRYNRLKKPNDGSRGNQHVEASDKVSPASAEAIAADHGVSARTVKRDGEFAEAVQTLGLERDVAAGQVKAAKEAIVEAAKALPAKPAKEAVEAAKAKLKEPPAKPPKPRREFRELPPTLMLEAIEHYATDFLSTCPARAGDLKQLLSKLSDRCSSHGE